MLVQHGKIFVGERAGGRAVITEKPKGIRDVESSDLAHMEDPATTKNSA